MTVYVSRDGGGNITGVYANRQPGLADEAIDDSDAGVVAYLASLVPDKDIPDLDTLRSAVTQMLSDINAYLAAADNGTTAQIQTRDHAAVKGLASDMKLVIKAIIALWGNGG